MHQWGHDFHQLGLLPTQQNRANYGLPGPLALRGGVQGLGVYKTSKYMQMCIICFNSFEPKGKTNVDA